MQNKITNFHTHTSRCKHADGIAKDYADVAQASGRCSALGFSDHVPFPDRIWQGCRMEPEEAVDYCKDIRALQGKYDFPVFLGFECEWHPTFKNWYKDYLREELKVDYLALGAHWVMKNGEGLYFDEFSDVKMLNTYRDQTIEGILSGNFDFIAHPDVMMMSYDCWDQKAKDCLIPILDATISMNMPVEINGNGAARPLMQTSKGLRHPYPIKEFWEEAGKRGATIICNSDAHNPNQVIDFALKAHAFANELGLTVSDFKL